MATSQRVELLAAFASLEPDKIPAAWARSKSVAQILSGVERQQTGIIKRLRCGMRRQFRGMVIPVLVADGYPSSALKIDHEQLETMGRRQDSS